MRLRSRKDYKRMGMHTKRHNGQYISIEVRNNNSSSTRLGITVTRRFGDAYRRNRFKRLVREAFRLSYPSLIKGLDINVRPHQGCYHLNLYQVQSEFLHFLKQSDV